MIDLSFLIWIIVPVMVIKMIIDASKKYVPQRDKYYEVPRDQSEKLILELKKSAGINRRKVRQALDITGDAIVDPKRMGWITGAVRDTNEYVIFVRPTFWKFWKKSHPFIVPADLNTDFHGKVVTVRGRDWKYIDGFSFLIPCYNQSRKIAEYWAERIVNHKLRYQLRLGLADLPKDMVVNALTASRGGLERAEKEIKKIGPIPEITEDELRYKRRGSENDTDRFSG